MNSFILILNLLVSPFFLCTPPAFAAQPAPLWQDAAQAYNAGEFLKAAGLYARVVESNQTAWQAHYNAGNAHFKSGNLALALEHYWHAFRLNPRHGPIARNLSLAAAKAGDTVAAPGVPYVLYRAWAWLTLEEWVVVCFAFWTALGLLLWLLRYGRLSRPWRRRVIQAALACAGVLLPAASMTASHALERRRPWTILKVPQVLRSGPSENLPVTAQVPEAHYVVFLETQGAWARIQTRKEKIQGWIKQ